MKQHYINTILTVSSLIFCATALAQPLSENEYLSIKKDIAAELQADLTHCTTAAVKQKHQCVSEAKSNTNLAVAELEARYRPSCQAAYKVSMIKAASNYVLSQEKCNAQVKDIKVLCLNLAQATRVDAESAAQAQLIKPDLNKRSQDERDFVPDPENSPTFPVTQHGYL